MTYVRRFLGLTAQEQTLVTLAGALLIVTRAMVHLESVPKIRAVLRRLVASRLAQTPGLSAVRIGRVVAAIRRRMPWTGACLSESLVTEALLTTNGHPAELFIGVKRRSGGGLDTHAWVKSGGKKVVCGVRHRSHYEALWSSRSQESIRLVRVVP